MDNKKVKYLSLGILLPLLSQVLFAQVPAADTVIRDLSLCDATLFQTIKKNESLFREHGPIKSKEKIAYWNVPNRTTEDGSVVLLSKPMNGQVSLMGYFDDIFDLEELGQYYSWGFLVKGTPERISAMLKARLHEGSRLRQDGEVFVRSEILDTRVENGQWIKNDKLSSGIIPKKHTIERVFMIEPAGEKYPGLSRVGCSLQGSVTQKILSTERPDIDSKEHP